MEANHNAHVIIMVADHIPTYYVPRTAESGFEVSDLFGMTLGVVYFAAD